MSQLSLRSLTSFLSFNPVKGSIFTCATQSDAHMTWPGLVPLLLLPTWKSKVHCTSFSLSWFLFILSQSYKGLLFLEVLKDCVCITIHKKSIPAATHTKDMLHNTYALVHSRVGVNCQIQHVWELEWGGLSINSCFPEVGLSRQTYMAPFEP